MSRLEEIKNEYAESIGFEDWEIMRCDKGIDDYDSDKVSELYAKECSHASLEKASKEAKIIKLISSGIGTHYEVNEESIIDKENIVLL